jgi:hypothetical protein
MSAVICNLHLAPVRTCGCTIKFDPPRPVPAVQAKPVAYTYDISTYREGDVRGRRWVPTISRIKPTQDWMLRDVVPLYAAPVPAVRPDLAHKPTVQHLMNLARQFRSAPSDLYDAHYRALQDACYAACAAAPPPVALSDEQIESVRRDLWPVAMDRDELESLLEFARAIEAHHGIGATT